MSKRMNNCWGDDDDDFICEAVKPLLSKALAACEDVITELLKAECEELEGAPFLELREKVWDIIVAVRKYEERREDEFAKARAQEEGK